MKCPKCGYEQAIYDDINEWWHCPQCHGSGEVQMTNEEWLRSAGTDGITAIFMQFMFDAEFKVRFINGNFVSEFRKWLKEIHE